MSGGDERRAHADRVVDGLLDSLRRNDMRAFADHWAPAGVMEFPFAPPGYRVLRSRNDVWDYVKDYSSQIRLDEVVEHRRHHTLDPDVVILEFSVQGAALQTGNDYRMDYVSVITVEPDGIAHFRDYWNSLAAATALGGVDTLMAEFGNGRTKEEDHTRNRILRNARLRRNPIEEPPLQPSRQDRRSRRDFGPGWLG